MATPPVKLDVHYADGLDYRYRDMFKAFVGEGEVVLEFANVNRSNPTEVTVGDRIVVSLPSAIRLVNHLQEELRRARDRFEQQAAEQA